MKEALWSYLSFSNLYQALLATFVRDGKEGVISSFPFLLFSLVRKQRVDAFLSPAIQVIIFDPEVLGRRP